MRVPQSYMLGGPRGHGVVVPWGYCGGRGEEGVGAGGALGNVKKRTSCCWSSRRLPHSNDSRRLEEGKGGAMCYAGWT